MTVGWRYRRKRPCFPGAGGRTAEYPEDDKPVVVSRGGSEGGKCTAEEAGADEGAEAAGCVRGDAPGGCSCEEAEEEGGVGEVEEPGGVAEEAKVAADGLVGVCPEPGVLGEFAKGLCWVSLAVGGGAGYVLRVLALPEVLLDGVFS